MSKICICKDCRHYKLVCIEYNVLSNMPIEFCPVQGYEPIRKMPLQSHTVFETVGDIQTKTVLSKKRKKEEWLFT